MKFDGWQMITALDVGGRREVLARHLKRSEPHGTPERDSWEGNIEGAGAEYLASIETGLPWHMEIKKDLFPKPPDVGDDIEVRWTRHADGHLTIYDDDPIERRYCLVIGRMPNLELVGIVEGERVMIGKYRGKTPRGTPCWWIPRDVVG